MRANLKRSGEVALGARRRRRGRRARSGAHRRLSGPTRATRAESRPTGRAELPSRATGSAKPPRAAARSPGALVVEHHPVVMVVAGPHDDGTGKEHDRENEDDAGDDDDPRGGRVERGRLDPRRRRGGDRMLRGCRFRYFTHPFIVPGRQSSQRHSDNKLAENWCRAFVAYRMRRARRSRRAPG